MQSERVLVTGAAGRIATGIRPYLAPLFGAVRLVDTRPVEALAAHEEQLVGDLHDGDVMRQALHQVTGVVHLTGLHANASREEHHRLNVALTETLFAHAVDARVHRIALASTMHVLGMYRRTERIGLDSPPQPDCPGAETKAEMESLARTAAHAHGLRVCSVRIGCYTSERKASEPCSWIGPADLARLFWHVLYHPRGAAPVVHGVAPYRGDDCGQREMHGRYGFVFTHRGGIAWKDRLMLRRWYPTRRDARVYRGGVFAWATLNGVQIP